MCRRKGRKLMEKVYSNEYLNNDSTILIERAKQKFQSKYPEKYIGIDYNSKISDADVIAIEKIFGIQIPKYVEDMKARGMTDKYQAVRNRYLVNSIRDKVNKEREEFNKASGNSTLKNKVQSIGKSLLRIGQNCKEQAI